MPTLLYVATGVIGLLILASHVLSAFGRDAVSRIATYVGLVCHVILFALLLLLGSKIETAVLVFMASVFVYAVLCAAAHYLVPRKQETEEKEETNV